MKFKTFYIKHILRKQKKIFLEYVGISGTSLIYYLNGRVPRKKIIEKIIEYSKKYTSDPLTIESFY